MVDAMTKFYNIGRKSMRWYRRIFFYLLEVSIHNAYVISSSCQRADKPKATTLQFRMKLIEYLIGDVRAAHCPRRSISTESLGRLQGVGRHLPAFSKSSRNCEVCSVRIHKSGRRERPSRSRIYCKECNKHLCIHGGKRCFELYHTHAEFWLVE